MTTVYEAINLAADRIERDPSSYRFCRGHVPCDGEPGCMWGHIGRALSLLPGTEIWKASKACGVSDAHLYLFGSTKDEYNGFTYDPAIAAKLLRAYANEFHAPKGSLRALTAVDESFVQLPAFITAQPKRDLIPASVREIFDRTYTAKDLTV